MGDNYTFYLDPGFKSLLKLDKDLSTEVEQVRQYRKNITVMLQTKFMLKWKGMK